MQARAWGNGKEQKGAGITDELAYEAARRQNCNRDADGLGVVITVGGWSVGG
jgi:hypothetical protein